MRPPGKIKSIGARRAASNRELKFGVHKNKILRAKPIGPQDHSS